MYTRIAYGDVGALLRNVGHATTTVTRIATVVDRTVRCSSFEFETAQVSAEGLSLDKGHFVFLGVVPFDAAKHLDHDVSFGAGVVSNHLVLNPKEVVDRLFKWLRFLAPLRNAEWVHMISRSRSHVTRFGQEKSWLKGVS